MDTRDQRIMSTLHQVQVLVRDYPNTGKRRAIENRLGRISVDLKKKMKEAPGRV